MEGLWTDKPSVLFNWRVVNSSCIACRQWGIFGLSKRVWGHWNCGMKGHGILGGVIKPKVREVFNFSSTTIMRVSSHGMRRAGNKRSICGRYGIRVGCRGLDNLRAWDKVEEVNVVSAWGEDFVDRGLRSRLSMVLRQKFVGWFSLKIMDNLFG